MKTEGNLVSAWPSQCQGQKVNAELLAGFRVWLTRHTCHDCTHTLCNYTVYVEPRFIYCNVKNIYIFTFLKKRQWKSQVGKTWPRLFNATLVILTLLLGKQLDFVSSCPHARLPASPASVYLLVKLINWFGTRLACAARPKGREIGRAHV